jgi:hypothetical protein
MHLLEWSGDARLVPFLSFIPARESFNQTPKPDSFSAGLQQVPHVPPNREAHLPKGGEYAQLRSSLTLLILTNPSKCKPQTRVQRPHES